MSDKTIDFSKSELENLKKSIKELQKIVVTLSRENKYFVRHIKRLSGELIQLQHEIDGIRAHDRRKKG